MTCSNFLFQKKHADGYNSPIIVTPEKKVIDLPDFDLVHSLVTMAKRQMTTELWGPKQAKRFHARRRRVRSPPYNPRQSEDVATPDWCFVHNRVIDRTEWERDSYMRSIQYGGCPLFTSACICPGRNHSRCFVTNPCPWATIGSHHPQWEYDWIHRVESSTPGQYLEIEHETMMQMGG